MSQLDTCDDVTTRDITLSQAHSDLATPSSCMEDTLDVENLSNSPVSLHNSSPVNEQEEPFPLGGELGTESFLTSLGNVTSLDRDFPTFDGGYHQQPGPLNDLDGHRMIQQTTPHLLNELTRDLVYPTESVVDHGFQHSGGGADNATPHIWRPMFGEISELQNFQNQRPVTDWPNACQQHDIFSTTRPAQQEQTTNNEIIDLTESVTSLDDVSNTSDSLRNTPPAENSFIQDGGLYQNDGTNGNTFFQEPFSAEYLTSDTVLPRSHALPLQNCPQMTSEQPYAFGQNFSAPQNGISSTYSAPCTNVFEQAVTQQSTNWSSPLAALTSSAVQNVRPYQEQGVSTVEATLNPNDAQLSTPDVSALPTNFPSIPLRPTIELSNHELWMKFFELGTEMIITKAGRRMFPSVKLTIRDLDPKKNYALAIDIQPVDNNRYRYVYHSSQWMAAGTTEAPTTPRTYFHPDSPSRGEFWMRQSICFDKLKLTNYEMNRKGHIILHSMHKYQPRIHLIECQTESKTELQGLLPLPIHHDVTTDDVTTVVFPECAFTTVTAYQNQQITKLKIDRNPFAKGFRDSNKQWKPKPAVEKPKRVWTVPGDPSHKPVPTTIDLTSEQYQHHILNRLPTQPQYQHISSPCVNAKYSQPDQFNTNTQCASGDAIRPVLSKDEMPATFTNFPTANLISTSTANNHAPLKRDEFTLEVTRRNSSVQQGALQMVDFDFSDASDCIPQQIQERLPSAQGNYFSFAPDSGSEGGMAELLGTDSSQMLLRKPAFDSFQTIFSEP